MGERIFIAGATARCAAQSAARAGWDVTAADLFADRDTTACARVWRVERYPQEFAVVARRITACPWIYTGGLENAPHLVGAVSRHHHLLGNPPAVLRQVLDPWLVQRALATRGLLFPETRAQAPLERDSSWLCKPRRSCGGAGIHIWTPVAEKSVQPGSPDRALRNAATELFQQRIAGTCHGALFVATGNACRLLSITRQFTGCGWAGTTDFRYVGSVGPLRCHTTVVDQFQRIGTCLTEAFGLRGLFGVDAIVTGRQVWTIEVNPRFTASVEIYERATGSNALLDHWHACERSVLPPPPNPLRGTMHGKAIAYAREPVRVSERFCQWIDAHNQPGCLPRLADLPACGIEIAAGHPILTVLVEGSTLTEIVRRLRREIAAVWAACARQVKPPA
jgi:predicted ATP-grasp superfamily ATP-dependent carboligase